MAFTCSLSKTSVVSPCGALSVSVGPAPSDSAKREMLASWGDHIEAKRETHGDVFWKKWKFANWKITRKLIGKYQRFTYLGYFQLWKKQLPERKPHIARFLETFIYFLCSDRQILGMKYIIYCISSLWVPSGKHSKSMNTNHFVL